ncbi:rhomboid family intramembrane serine protease [Acidianus sp. RZ1]|uniref:rhomboid family intramembrane serine protease n=1 Tax=Acidianus sp. RZ1 TaxID=1540082 RepID=UPI0020A51AEB|nr:rhomboid family intramembrane serine protease [Acidianus sp. RZ1]
MKPTIVIMALVVLGYAVGVITSNFYPSIFFYLIQVNYLVFQGYYLSLVTSIFVTNSLLDFSLNFLALAVIYALFRSKAGKIEYLVFFFSGILGNILSLFLFPPLVASEGASGGIFGVFAFYLVDDMLELHRFDWNDLGILLFVFIASDILPNVDYFAHIGGILGGVILAVLADRLNRGKRESWRI